MSSTPRKRLEEARQRAAEAEEALRKSSTESNLDDVSSRCGTLRSRGSRPRGQLGKREETQEVAVHLQPDETIEDAFRRFQRDETDHSVLHLVLYIRNADRNGPKRCCKECSAAEDDDDDGADFISEFGDETTAAPIGEAQPALCEPPAPIAERKVSPNADKLPSAFAVKPEAVDALWARLSREATAPRRCTLLRATRARPLLTPCALRLAVGPGRPNHRRVRFQSVDWQKGRIRSFLFASAGHEERAYKLCREHYAWLASYRPHVIAQSDIAHERESGKVRWLGQRSNDGRWVLFYRASLHHVAESKRKEALQLWFYYINDFIERRAEHPLASFNGVVDVRDLARDNLDPALFRKLLRLLCKHYPTILHRFYIIEPSWLFHYAHAILRPFVSHRFWESMTMLKAPHWRRELRAVIGEANLKELDAIASHRAARRRRAGSVARAPAYAQPRHAPHCMCACLRALHCPISLLHLLG